jgi:phosphohistidine phosphatase SixA
MAPGNGVDQGVCVPGGSLRRGLGHLPILARAFIAAAGLSVACAQSLSGAPLVSALRAGGCVLLMRHASSPRTPPSPDAAAPDNRNLERQLDEQGRSSARAMGEAFRRLGVPIGAIWSSPTYRAHETVRFAGLGPAMDVAELGDGAQSMQAQADQSRIAWLRRAVTAPPPAGTNTLLVTHGPNILGAFAERAADIDDGEIMVFRPDGSGSATLLARVRISEWPLLARVP